MSFTVFHYKLLILNEQEKQNIITTDNRQSWQKVNSFQGKCLLQNDLIKDSRQTCVSLSIHNFSLVKSVYCVRGDFSSFFTMQSYQLFIVNHMRGIVCGFIKKQIQ